MTRTKKRPMALSAAAVAGAGALILSATPAQAQTMVEWPDEFTSAYSVMATPDQVIDTDDNPAPGEPGASGDMMFWINSDTETICWEITLEGVTGGYESPADTATHIHEAETGEQGPPRLAFPDPEPIGDGPRESSGCMQGPFTTGLEGDDGADTAEGFSLAEIEANPAGFQGDSHTEMFPDGVVRGQLVQVPLDGVETGGGGASETSTAVAAAPSANSAAGTAAIAGLSGLLLAATAGAVVFARRRSES